jgi:hypothetical protein
MKQMLGITSKTGRGDEPKKIQNGTPDGEADG